MTTKVIRLSLADILAHESDYLVVSRRRHWPRGKVPLQRAVAAYLKRINDGDYAGAPRVLLPAVESGVEIVAVSRPGQQALKDIATAATTKQTTRDNHRQYLAFFDPFAHTAREFTAQQQTSSTASRHQYLLFHKPFGVLSQFSQPTEGARTLADYGLPAEVYPVGRLDKDSEGLLLLTNDGAAQKRIASPKAKLGKTYWAQVDRIPDDTALTALATGVVIAGGYRTQPAQVSRIAPAPPPRNPPIRYRKNVPTAWLQITITEGKNRQIRKMTAAVGHPTLRLIRVGVGKHELGDLEAGKFRELESF